MTPTYTVEIIKASYLTRQEPLTAHSSCQESSFQVNAKNEGEQSRLGFQQAHQEPPSFAAYIKMSTKK